MGEIYNYLASKYFKSASSNGVELDKVLVKGTIESLCSENLKEMGEVFTFEVLTKDLPYAVTVIDEEPLKSKYLINQISKTLFQATIKEVNL